MSKEDRDKGDEQLLGESLDEKTMKKLAKLNEKTIKKLGKLYGEYVDSAAQQALSKKSVNRERSKGDDLLRNFEESVFNWDNKATKKPAFDAFKNVLVGFNNLGKTFDARQKEIVAETGFGKNMTTMVALMRQQIETSEQAAKSQRRRFYISLTVAVISAIVAAVRILL